MSSHLRHLLSEGEPQRYDLILEEEAETKSWAHHCPDDWSERAEWVCGYFLSLTKADSINKYFKILLLLLHFFLQPFIYSYMRLL